MRLRTLTFAVTAAALSLGVDTPSRAQDHPAPEPAEPEEPVVADAPDPADPAQEGDPAEPERAPPPDPKELLAQAAERQGGAALCPPEGELVSVHAHFPIVYLERESDGTDGSRNLQTD